MEHAVAAAPTHQRGFSPYVDNGGFANSFSPPFQGPKNQTNQNKKKNNRTTMGISGKDFVIMAGDTRLSTGYSIQTRKSTKLCKLFVV